MNNKGFTVIELVMAVVIMVLLTLVITPAVTNVIKKNKVNNCQSLISSIENAASLYVSDYRYSISLDSNMKATIKLETLINQNYVKGDLVNPLDEYDARSNLDNEYVVATFNSTSKKFSFEYKGKINCGN